MWSEAASHCHLHAQTIANQGGHEFLRLLKRQSKNESKNKRFDFFPKGASAAVDAVAEEFVAKRGAEELNKVARMRFRTALRAQGLPEPPKAPWQRR